MNKKSAIIYIVAAFAAGVIIAGGGVGYFLIRRLVVERKFVDYGFECQPEMSTALISLHTLHQLRSVQTSNSNTIEYLETQLDYSIAGIGKYVERLPLQDHDSFPAVTNVLLGAKRYRAQFPHTNQDALIQGQIDRAFSLVNEKSKR